MLFRSDPRIAHVDRTERIVRLLVLSGSEDIAARLGTQGATGIRILDLNLEDIFLYAVSPKNGSAWRIDRMLLVRANNGEFT